MLCGRKQLKVEKESETNLARAEKKVEVGACHDDALGGGEKWKAGGGKGS